MSTLAPSNVQWIDCPESTYEALIHYSAMLGVATLTPDFSETLPEMRNDAEIRCVENGRLKTTWGLIRRAGYQRKALESAWRMASQSARIERAA